MLKSKYKNKVFQLTTLAFVISCVLFLLICMLLEIAPFGDGTLFFSDLGSQYIPFLSHFKHLFEVPSEIIYSFSNGIGSNMLPLVAYYLTSPFNLLVLFFSVDYLPYAVLLIIMLKIACSASAMAFYLQKTYSSRNSVVLFACCYAFSGFVGSYFYNIMWLDALIWLPLIVYAFQLFLDKNKSLPYGICLFFTLLSNYYLGYMICLFLVLYFFYWTLQGKQFSSLREYLRENVKKFLYFAGYSIVIVMSLGVLLLPTVTGMLQTGKSEFSLSLFFPQLLFGLDGLTGFSLGISNFSSRLQHLPTLYMGLLPLLCVLYFFLNKKISKRQKKIKGLFLSVLFLCLIFKPLAVIFQMFQETAGFPFRQSFLVIFFMMVLAYEGWIDRKEVSKASYWRSFLLISSVFLLGFLYNQLFYNVSNLPQLRLYPLLFSLLFLFFYTLYQIFCKNQKREVFFLFLFCCLEVSVNFWLMVSNAPFGNINAYQNYVQDVEKALVGYSGAKKELSRVDNTYLHAIDYEVRSSGYNEGLLFSYYGTTSYTSTLSSEIVEAYSNLGLYSWNERRISYVGSTPITDLLLNVKQQLVSDKNSVELEETFRSKGIGFAVSNELRNVKLEKENPFQNQNKIFQILFQTQENIFTEATVTPSSEENQTDTIYQATVTPSVSGELYLFLPATRNKQSYEEVYVDGKKVEIKLQIKNQTLLHVTNCEKEKPIEITIKSSVKIAKSDIEFKVFDRELYNKEFHKEQFTILQNINWDKNTLTGTVDGIGENQMLFVSIPYDTNWQLEVDGKKQSFTKVLDGFIGIPLTSGKHSITLSYRPFEVKLGLFISIIGSILFIFIEWKKYKKIKLLSFQQLQNNK